VCTGGVCTVCNLPVSDQTSQIYRLVPRDVITLMLVDMSTDTQMFSSVTCLSAYHIQPTSLPAYQPTYLPPPPPPRVIQRPSPDEPLMAFHCCEISVIEGGASKSEGEAILSLLRLRVVLRM